MTAALMLRGLRYGAGAFRLGPLDLELAAGERLLLCGPSGSGKTTLLRLIAGLDEPGGGSVHCGGCVVSGDGVAVPPHARGLGFVFQQNALWPHLTVAENIGFGLASPAAPRVAELLAAGGLAGYGTRRPGTLSGGEARRVAVMRALAARPALLLLDEPLVWLDPMSRAAVIRLLETELAATGAACIHVTHEPEPGLRCDRRVLLQAGQLSNG